MDRAWGWGERGTTGAPGSVLAHRRAGPGAEVRGRSRPGTGGGGRLAAGPASDWVSTPAAGPVAAGLLLRRLRPVRRPARVRAGSRRPPRAWRRRSLARARRDVAVGAGSTGAPGPVVSSELRRLRARLRSSPALHRLPCRALSLDGTTGRPPAARRACSITPPPRGVSANRLRGRPRFRVVRGVGDDTRRRGTGRRHDDGRLPPEDSLHPPGSAMESASASRPTPDRPVQQCGEALLARPTVTNGRPVQVALSQHAGHMISDLAPADRRWTEIPGRLDQEGHQAGDAPGPTHTEIPPKRTTVPAPGVTSSWSVTPRRSGP